MLAAFIAQLVEHSFSKRKVHGSTPCGGRKYFFVLRIACPASARVLLTQCQAQHKATKPSVREPMGLLHANEVGIHNHAGSRASGLLTSPFQAFRDRSCFPVWRSSGTSTTDCSKAISVSLQFTTTSNEPRWMSTLCHGIWLLQ